MENPNINKMSMLVSKRCPMECAGCYNDKKSGQILSAEQNIYFAKILKKLGYNAITLSGGDPLARDDIKTVIQGIDSLGFDINLDTTGVQLLNYESERPITPREIAKSIDLIGIPLDGSNDETIYKFRSKNGASLKKTEKILELLDAENCKISINTVVHSENIDDLDGIYHIISGYLNVVRWELHQFVALGGGSIMNESRFRVEDDAFRRAVDGIVNNEEIIIDAKPRQNKQNFSYLDFDGQFKKVIDGQTRTLFNIRDLNETDLMDAISWSS